MNAAVAGREITGSDRFPAAVVRMGTITEAEMRAILLWLLGIPIPIIILLYVFHVI